MNKNQLDWKARRDGRFYCAPACGHRCTWEAYQAARKQGGSLARQLGSGWKSEVWENLGWHFKAQHESRLLWVYPCQTIEEYWADIHAGRYQWVAYGKTPADAVENAKRQVQAELISLKKVIELVDGI